MSKSKTVVYTMEVDLNGLEDDIPENYAVHFCKATGLSGEGVFHVVSMPNEDEFFDCLIRLGDKVEYVPSVLVQSNLPVQSEPKV